MKKLVLLAVGIFAASAVADVDMKSGMCVNAGDQLNINYTNNTRTPGICASGA